MDGTLPLALLFFAVLHLTAPASVLHSGQSSKERSSQTITDAELRKAPSRPNSKRPRAAVTPPLDVVFAKQRLYEPPATLEFAVVTPFDPDNREAGVELRCNAQAVASTIWTLDEKSDSVREFRWELRDANCLYEVVAILTRTKDYVYLYQMVPSRAWLPSRIPSRQLGRGSRLKASDMRLGAVTAIGLVVSSASSAKKGRNDAVPMRPSGLTSL